VAKKKSTFYNKSSASSQQQPQQSSQSSRPSHVAQPTGSSSGSGSSTAALLNVENLGSYLRQRFSPSFPPTSEMLRVAAREYIGDVQHLDLASIFYMTSGSNTITPNSFLGMAAAMEVKFGQAGMKEHQMSRRIASALANHAAISAAGGGGNRGGGFG